MSNNPQFTPDLINVVDPLLVTIETCQQQGPRSNAFESQSDNLRSVFDQLDALLNEIDSYNKEDRLVIDELNDILNVQSQQLEDFQAFVQSVAAKDIHQGVADSAPTGPAQ